SLPDALPISVILALALMHLRYLPDLAELRGGRLSFGRVWETVFCQRWNPPVTGALEGVIGVFAYFRVEPLGVTAQFGSMTRTFLTNAGLIAELLLWLGSVAGCR